jgi:hypothetical protein
MLCNPPIGGTHAVHRLFFNVARTLLTSPERIASNMRAWPGLGCIWSPSIPVSIRYTRDPGSGGADFKSPMGGSDVHTSGPENSSKHQHAFALVCARRDAPRKKLNNLLLFGRVCVCTWFGIRNTPSKTYSLYSSLAWGLVAIGELFGSGFRLRGRCQVYGLKILGYQLQQPHKKECEIRKLTTIEKQTNFSPSARAC